MSRMKSALYACGLAVLLSGSMFQNAFATDVEKFYLVTTKDAYAALSKNGYINSDGISSENNSALILLTLPKHKANIEKFFSNSGTQIQYKEWDAPYSKVLRDMRNLVDAIAIKEDDYKSADVQSLLKKYGYVTIGDPVIATE